MSLASLGNCSLRCSTSCIPAVVLPPMRYGIPAALLRLRRNRTTVIAYAAEGGFTRNGFGAVLFTLRANRVAPRA